MKYLYFVSYFIVLFIHSFTLDATRLKLMCHKHNTYQNCEKNCTVDKLSMTAFLKITSSSVESITFFP